MAAQLMHLASQLTLVGWRPHRQSCAQRGPCKCPRVVRECERERERAWLLLSSKLSRQGHILGICHYTVQRTINQAASSLPLPSVIFLVHRPSSIVHRPSSKIPGHHITSYRNRLVALSLAACPQQIHLASIGVRTSPPG
jgi:hypothetical protein